MDTNDSVELIPAELLCLEFINSEWGDFRGRWRKDYLLQPEWLQEFQGKWRLEIGSAPTQDELQALIALRSLMRRIVASLPSGGPDEEELQLLNAIFQESPSMRRLAWQAEAFKLDIEPLVRDWKWVMAEIADSFADVLAYGDLQRLKICENPHCRRIFYDETRSRTKRWCTNEKCGNLWKLRRFRARQKKAALG